MLNPWPISDKVGHSHRHASLMQVEIISEVAPSVMNPQLNLFGLARWLTQTSKDVKKEVAKMNFSCRHCIDREDEETPVGKDHADAFGMENSWYKQLPWAEGANNQGKPKEFNFNGLRSHLNSK